MLIDGQKWACEACIRGHRVTSCKHHDRPLIRIKRKGRPFATCSVCHATPCSSPSEHARARREAELKSPSKKPPHARLYPRHPNPAGFLPIAPRPDSNNGKNKNNKKTPPLSRSASTSASARASSSSAQLPSLASSERASSISHAALGPEDWSGSEASGAESHTPLHRLSITSESSAAGAQTSMVQPNMSFAQSAPGILSHQDHTSSLLPQAIMFDPAYSLLPTTSTASSVSDAQLTQKLVSPSEGVNPFDFPLDPVLALGDGSLGCLDDLDVEMTEGLSDDTFHVEDWSRYMWSPETGFEHLDTGFPPPPRSE